MNPSSADGESRKQTHPDHHKAARFMADEPRDPLLPEESRRRPPSPDGLGPERKRRRKVLSCFDCRRRKLQCDRVLPSCGRCTKAGQADSCLYIDDPSEAPAKNGDSTTHATPEAPRRGPLDAALYRPSHSTPTGSDAVTRLEWQDKRIKQLEDELAFAAKNANTPLRRLVAAAGASTAPTSPAQIDEKPTVQEHETVLMRGRSFKTQFFGSTHPGALTAHLSDLNLFIRDAFEQCPSFARMRNDMGALEERTFYAGSRPSIVDDDDLRRLLPAKAEADQLIQLFMDTIGVIYRIFHYPSFQEEYNKMWSDLTNAKAHTVALVLSMMATVQCLTPLVPQTYRANSSMTRETGVAFVHACESWLQWQSQKHVTIVDFQIRCLLFLAKITNGRKFKRTWTEAGALLRFCMSAGLHRDPNLLRKRTSPLDKELRRRVWAMVADLEAQAAFDRGMVSEALDSSSDCQAPLNISDDAINQETDQLPNPASRSAMTSCSYLALCMETCALRSNLNTALNSVREPLGLREINAYTQQLERIMHQMPELNGPGSDIAYGLLRLKLWQYLLALHDRKVRMAESVSERTHSRLALLDTASKMLKVHQSLVNKGIYVLEILRSDQLRCALSLCHLQTSSEPYDILGSVIKVEVFPLVEIVVGQLIDKCLRFGREQFPLWIALAAAGLMKSRVDPANRVKYLQEAVDTVLGPYYKIIACQQEAPPPSSNTGGTHSEAETPKQAFSQYPPPVPKATMTTSTGGANADPFTLDMDQIAAWTFDDWSFDPNDYAEFV